MLGVVGFVFRLGAVFAWVAEQYREVMTAMGQWENEPRGMEDFVFLCADSTLFISNLTETGKGPKQAPLATGDQESRQNCWSAQQNKGGMRS
ncbi:hypothetical protein C8R45DRAFT_1028270 [Mycena sanguinolenta]|nr:hypothetical protein C8R45DRAFT_1028270 [Mycena sanguinolenta]